MQTYAFWMSRYLAAIVWIGLVASAAVPQTTAASSLFECQDSEPPPDVPASEVSPEIRDSIQNFFAELQSKIDKQNSNSAREYLALPELSAIVRNQPKLAPLSLDDSQLEKKLSGYWSTGMEAWQQEFYWSEHRITQIERVQANHFVATVRHYQDEDQLFIKLKWTLVQQPDSSWKFADIRDIEQNVAISTLLAAMIAEPEGQPEWLLPTKRWLLAGSNHEFLDDDLRPAVEILEAMDDILDWDPPAEYQAYFLTLKTSLWMMAGDVDQAAIELHNFEQLGGTYPIAHYFKGGLLMENEEYRAAIAQYERYAELTGWDPDVCEMVADCYWNVDNNERAIEFAQRGLEDQPTAYGCLATLALALPAERKPELEKWFKANDYEPDMLAYVIDWALTNEDQPTAAYVFDLLQKHHPRSPLVKELRMLIDR